MIDKQNKKPTTTNSEINIFTHTLMYIMLSLVSTTLISQSFKKINEPIIPQESHTDWVKSELDTQSGFGLDLISMTEDKIGQTHYRYNQTFDGYKVQDAHYTIHTNEESILSVNGDYIKPIKDLNKILISPEDAFQIALNDSVSTLYMNSPTYELVVLMDSDIPILTYKVDVYSAEPLYRHFLYINASDGEILRKDNRIQLNDTQGISHTMYQGIQTITTDSVSSNLYKLVDNGRNISTYDLNSQTQYSMAVDFTDSDNIWTSTVNKDDAALDAHWGSEKTYDYYLLKLGRDSYDGNGSTINSYVHFAYNYSNAFWDGQRMTYGDGDPIYYTPLISIDIVAHEITHGVTHTSSNLVYINESGQLNESYSDIFGATIRHYAAPSTFQWTIGDQIQVNGNGFRNMSNPNSKLMPNTYHGNYWYFGLVDYGGVHHNSAVQNYWYVLLVEGGFGTNDNGNAYAVQGLGFDVAAAIAYRTLTVYLGPNSQYIDARNYSIQSAVDLYGACSYEVVQTTNAWYAVGIGNSYENYAVSGFTTTDVYSCAFPYDVQFVNGSLNGSTQIWDFGDGTTDTSFAPMHTYTNNGIYDVSLITYSSSLCGFISDTLVVYNLIEIEPTPSTVVPANCIPLQSSQPNAIYGPQHVKLDVLDYNTSGVPSTYEDYTCLTKKVILDGTDTLEVWSGSYYVNVRAWIDWNNDGSFDSTELVLSADSVQGWQDSAITIPSYAVRDIELRLRILSGTRYHTLPTPCTDPIGNYYSLEDYTIEIPSCNVPTTTQNGNWNDPETWCSNIIPNITDSVIISSNHIVTIDSNLSGNCSALIINSNGRVNIIGSLTVDNNIINNGIVYVRDNASLIQNVSNFSNGGNGDYYIYRIGNTNQSSYNAWGSPIDSAYIPSVFSNTNPWDTYLFDGSSQSWGYDSDNYMDIGRGYFIPGDSTNSVNNKVFIGEINNGEILFKINTTTIGNNPRWDDDDWNLISNPYPSAISVDALYQLNLNKLSDGIYWWDDGTVPYDQNGDYSVYNLSGGVASNNSNVVPNGYISTGQGVFIITDTTIGSSDSINLVFNNSLRTTTTNNQFFKKSSSNDLLWITLTNSLYKSTILISSTPNTTDGFDPLYDAHAIRYGVVQMTTVNNDEKFIIEGIKPLLFGETRIIPLDVNVQNFSIYSFKIDSILNFNGYDVWIIDTNEVNPTYISKGNNYDVYLHPGSFTNRFSIGIKNNYIDTVVVDNIQDIESLKFTVDQYGNSLRLNTNTPNDVFIYDVVGKLLYHNKLSDELIIDTSNWRVGVYIISHNSTQIKVVIIK